MEASVSQISWSAVACWLAITGDACSRATFFTPKASSSAYSTTYNMPVPSPAWVRNARRPKVRPENARSSRTSLNGLSWASAWPCNSPIRVTGGRTARAPCRSVLQPQASARRSGVLRPPAEAESLEEAGQLDARVRVQRRQCPHASVPIQRILQHLLEALV